MIVRSLYRCIPALCLVLFLVSCEEKEREPENTLKEALEALEKNDHDGYLKHVDMGDDMDAAKTAYMKDALRQHVGWRRSERAAVLSIDMIDAQMNGDSICTVYYQYSFADGTKEVGAQKMVRHGQEWKLRLRN